MLHPVILCTQNLQCWRLRRQQGSMDKKEGRDVRLHLINKTCLSLLGLKANGNDISQDLVEVVKRDLVEAILDGHLLLHLCKLAALDLSRLQAYRICASGAIGRPKEQRHLPLARKSTMQYACLAQHSSPTEAGRGPPAE